MLVLWMQLHAKQQNDVKLMVEVMQLVKKNDLPLQPGTADIVFRYMSIDQAFEFSLVTPIEYRFISFTFWFLVFYKVWSFCLSSHRLLNEIYELTYIPC